VRSNFAFAMASLLLLMKILKNIFLGRGTISSLACHSRKTRLYTRLDETLSIAKGKICEPEGFQGVSCDLQDNAQNSKFQ